MNAAAAGEGSRRYPHIEGLRGVAAFAVFASHVLAFAYQNEPHGFETRFAQNIAPFGVALFFCISGFVLYRPLVARRQQGPLGPILPRFALRRFVRIVPAYWLALTLVAALPAVPGVFGDDWFAYYGFLQIYRQDWFLGGGLGVAWTLCVEVTFYLALPLIALALHRRGVASGRPGGVRTELLALGAIVVLALAVRGVALDAGEFRVGHYLPAMLAWFAGGMAVAALTLVPGDPNPVARGLAALGARPWVCVCAAAGVFAFLLALPNAQVDDPREFGEVVLEFGCFALLALLVFLPSVYPSRGSAPHAFLASRPMAALGAVSYGVYLWHFPLVMQLSTTDLVQASPLPVVTLLVLSLAATLVAATLSWRLVERPLLRWAGSGLGWRWRWRRAAEAPPASQPALKAS